MRSTFRPLAAFMIAVVIAAALGSAIQTQFNLAFIARLGIEVPLTIRLETTAADLLGFGPLFAALVAAALAVGFLVAEPLARRTAGWRGLVYALTGGLSMAAAILLVNAALPMTPIAATRVPAGIVSLALVGAVGGWAYYAIRRG